MRFDDTHLRDLALLALEDAVQECRYRCPRRSVAIRFALAYLCGAGRCDRAPFDEFWRCLTIDAAWRFSSTDSALLRIYIALDLKRDDAVSMRLWKQWVAEEGRGGRDGR